MAGGMSFARRREALELASRALDGVDESLWQAQGGELGPFMALVDRLGVRAGTARVAVLSEAVDRGETGDKPGAVHTWLMEWAPSLRTGGSAQLVKVVDASSEQRYAQLREALLQARVTVGNAACVVDELERLRHRLHPDAHEDAMGALVALAENGRPRDIRRLRQDLVARYGHHGELQVEQDRLRERTSLSQPIGDGGGLFDYHLVVDAEAKAVIEAALGPLSAPRPVEGEPDRRPSGQRRLEALLDVVRRGVASADGVATTPKSQLFVTMALDDLVARTNAGTVVGSADAGALLAPETVRRLACDAGLVPVVLGGRGELLEMGRSTRYFTEAQVRALWLRDGGCSFPGCTVPAAWCDAHHLWHWCDGGSSDLDHGALLCGRHHSVVHAKGYHGEVVDGRVHWDLTPGAYDHWLAQRRAQAGDRAAGYQPEPAPVREYDVWHQLTTDAGDPELPPWRP